MQSVVPKNFLKEICRHRQVVMGVPGRLELAHLLAGNAKFLAYMLDASNTSLKSIVLKLGLQTLGLVGLPRACLHHL